MEPGDAGKVLFDTLPKFYCITFVFYTEALEKKMKPFTRFEAAISHTCTLSKLLTIVMLVYPMALWGQTSPQKTIKIKGKVTDHLTAAAIGGIYISTSADTQTTVTNRRGEFYLYLRDTMGGSTITIFARPVNPSAPEEGHTHIAEGTLALSSTGINEIHLYRYPEEHYNPVEIKWKRPLHIDYSPGIYLDEIERSHPSGYPELGLLIPNTYQRKRGGIEIPNSLSPRPVPPLQLYPVRKPLFNTIIDRWKTKKVE